MFPGHLNLGFGVLIRRLERDVHTAHEIRIVDHLRGETSCRQVCSPCPAACFSKPRKPRQGRIQLVCTEVGRRTVIDEGATVAITTSHSHHHTTADERALVMLVASTYYIGADRTRPHLPPKPTLWGNHTPRRARAPTDAC